MSKTFEIIKELVLKNEVKISAHGYDEMAEDNIFIKDVIADVGNGIVIENYDKYPKGRCVLVLEKDKDSRPIHVLGYSQRKIFSSCSCNSLQARYKNVDR